MPQETEWDLPLLLGLELTKASMGRRCCIFPVSLLFYSCARRCYLKPVAADTLSERATMENFDERN